MADKITAAETIRRLAVQYAHMMEAADALESMGKIEQTIKEGQAKADAARKDADAATAQAAEAAANIKAEQAKAKEIVAIANRQADQIIASAKLKAQEDAAHIIKRGQDEAATLIEKSATEKARLSSEIGGLQRAIEAGKSEIITINAAKTQAEDQLAEAQKMLAAAKAKVKALFTEGD